MDYYESCKHSNYALRQRRVDAEQYRLTQIVNPGGHHLTLLNQATRYRVGLLVGLCILFVLVAVTGTASAQVPVIDPGGFEDHPLEVSVWSGLKAFSDGHYETAIEHFTDSIDFAPDYVPAYAFRAASYYLVGEYETALVDFDTAIAMDAGYVSAYNWRAMTHLALGDFHRALDDSQMAIQLDPEYAEVYRTESGIYMAMGNYRMAVSRYAQYLTYIMHIRDKAA